MELRFVPKTQGARPCWQTKWITRTPLSSSDQALKAAKAAFRLVPVKRVEASKKITGAADLSGELAAT